MSDVSHYLQNKLAPDVISLEFKNSLKLALVLKFEYNHFGFVLLPSSFLKRWTSKCSLKIWGSEAELMNSPKHRAGFTLQHRGDTLLEGLLQKALETWNTTWFTFQPPFHSCLKLPKWGKNLTKGRVVVNLFLDRPFKAKFGLYQIKLHPLGPKSEASEEETWPLR